jgi:hypothetical protein
VKTTLNFYRALASLVVGCLSAWLSSAKSVAQDINPPVYIQPQTVGDLLDGIKNVWQNGVAYDQSGRVTKVSLVGKWCNDANLALVSQLSHLRELTLQGCGPTPEALRLLRNNTNLCALHLACCSHMTNGLLSEAATFAQVQELFLWGAEGTPADYKALGALTNLVHVRITDVLSFGDAELARFTNLPALKNLVIGSRELTESSAALLPQFRVLTNAQLRGWGGTGWSTNWHGAAVP